MGFYQIYTDCHISSLPSLALSLFSPCTPMHAAHPFIGKFMRLGVGAAAPLLVRVAFQVTHLLIFNFNLIQRLLAGLFSCMQFFTLRFDC